MIPLLGFGLIDCSLFLVSFWLTVLLMFAFLWSYSDFDFCL